MQLTAFRIKNFRSIVDSEWVPFSPDGITVFVGQNESGKSSVLEALFFALSIENPTADDFRIGTDLPVVHIRIRLTADDIDKHLHALKNFQTNSFKTYLTTIQDTVELKCHWEYKTSGDEKSLTAIREIVDTPLRDLVNEAKMAANSTSESIPELNDAVSQPQIDPNQATDQPTVVASPKSDAVEEPDPDIAAVLWSALPLGVFFNEESGRLPSQVDINEKGQPTGAGASAANNFLQIADINLPELLKGDRRARENTLNKANSQVSQDFNTFWSQTIGKSGRRLSLKCDIDHYGSAQAEKAGKPHLVFWICDGNTQLYPKQRSQGVRWFVSFYLQLKASEKARQRRVFLLDEPGANLHSKAQGDVLKLINRLGKDTSTVVYSTHSPQMLEYSKLFRVHAVQRDGDMDETPTLIIDAHRLGTASTDTLSPVLTAMGADLSQHQVIRKSNNVLLEEMSGYYYLSSFWKLLCVKTEVHFIAATGVNKIEALANMFRGWGLDFVVAVDDDKQGREAYNAMKRELFGDDPDLASKKMVKLPNCVAIEDVFSRSDFTRFVLEDTQASISGTNAEFVKSTSRSKPVLAFKFAIAVNEQRVTFELLSSETREKVQAIVNAINERL